MLCEKCRFWVAKGKIPHDPANIPDDFGECRKRPPSGGGVTAYFAQEKKCTRMLHVLYPFPVCHRADWCGEFDAGDAMLAACSHSQ